MKISTRIQNSQRISNIFTGAWKRIYTVVYEVGEILRTEGESAVERLAHAVLTPWANGRANGEDKARGSHTTWGGNICPWSQLWLSGGARPTGLSSVASAMLAPCRHHLLCAQSALAPPPLLPTTPGISKFTHFQLFEYLGQLK